MRRSPDSVSSQGNVQRRGCREKAQKSFPVFARFAPFCGNCPGSKFGSGSPAPSIFVAKDLSRKRGKPEIPEESRRIFSVLPRLRVSQTWTHGFLASCFKLWWPRVLGDALSRMKTTEPRIVVVVPPRKVSEILRHLHEKVQTSAVTLRQVIYVLRGRAYDLLLILLALPFATPIPVPGLSTPFGAAIAFIALRLALGRRPWLPKSLQRKKLPPGFFGMVLKFAARVLRLLESFLRPRLAAVTGSTLLLRLHAFVIFVAAVELLLPLPIPFTNTLPAIAIILMAGGLLERDGVAILLAYLVFAAGVAYFIFI